MNAKMRLGALLPALLLFALLMMGQTISSSLRGSLVDPAGRVVPNAKLVLTNQATGAALEARSASDGSFVFPNVLAGSYTLRAEATGFQSLEIKNIVVSASETRALGRLTLQLGDVRQTVSVTAQGAPVQLASSERSAVITDKQIQDILVRGRDLFALISMAPGVVDTAARRETTSPSSNAGIYINGGRQNQKNVTIDGITDLDTGSSQTVHFEPNMDAIAEIKILASNYQAEFGRNSGGVISVITKSGSRNFHGTAYDFYRHEGLNANSFFNNRAGSNPDGTPKVPKNPYRYRISGFSIGGPLYVPQKFNTGKSKFFFFFSQEYVGTKKDYGTKYFNMPTDLERNGDFSRSFDSSGALIRVIDPQTGQQFPGNIIPPNRINKLGQAILNFFPKPNYVETGDPRQFYSRNYKTAYSGDYPKRDDVIRIDASLKSSLQVFWRYVKDTDEQHDPTLNGSYFLTPSRSGKPGKGQTVHVTKGFSPTLVNEFLFGKSRNDIYWEPIDKAVVDRSRMGNPPLWFNHSNPNMNYIPNVAFGGQPSNVPAASVGGPFRNWNDIYSFLDNVGKVWGPHSLKAGIYIERTGKVQLGVAGYYRGLFNFSRNTNNPFDSGHSFANALLGNFNYYVETTDPPDSDWWFWNVEWYLQDNWKVSRRLTLDVGLRFYHLPPTEDLNHKSSTFDPRYYDPAKAPVLYVPAIDPVSRRRVAQDPISRAYAPAPLIGQFVPGSGDYANGMKVGGKDGYPPGLFTTGWLTLGPRFGFAYDLFGDGKTAIRGGFGVFKDRPSGNPSYGNANPPIIYSAAQYYGNLDTYAQSGGAIGPSELNTVLGDIKLASTMNFSLGVQRHIWKTTIDVAYVGGLSRHLIVRRNMNPIPMYARFDLPKNQDPTQPGSPLPDDFLRPYRGLSSITLWDFTGTSNYNALQVSASRRYTRGLQLGVAYTRSKTLGVAPDDYTAVSPYFAPRKRNYGPLAYDRPNMFGVNYIYDLPKVGTKTGFKPAGWVLDNWQISGVTAFVTGAPFSIGSGTRDGADITGSNEAARVTVIGNPKLSKSERTFYRFFNTGALARTPVRDFGNGGVNYLYGPGANNWDLAISKRIPLHGEGRYIRFRTEMFNAWNHTQFNAVGAGPAFDTFANGAKPTDPNFGVITGAGDPRLIQLSLKFYF
jgi:hypothetical protein